MPRRKKERKSRTINDIVPPELLGRMFELASAAERDDFDEPPEVNGEESDIFEEFCTVRSMGSV